MCRRSARAGGEEDGLCDCGGGEGCGRCERSRIGGERLGGAAVRCESAVRGLREGAVHRLPSTRQWPAVTARGQRAVSAIGTVVRRDNVRPTTPTASHRHHTRSHQEHRRRLRGKASNDGRGGRATYLVAGLGRSQLLSQRQPAVPKRQRQDSGKVREPAVKWQWKVEERQWKVKERQWKGQ